MNYFPVEFIFCSPWCIKPTLICLLWVDKGAEEAMSAEGHLDNGLVVGEGPPQEADVLATMALDSVLSQT